MSEKVTTKPVLPGDLHIAVVTALNLLREHDSELFGTRANVGTPQEQGASERSAAHRLAFYLEAVLKVVSFDPKEGNLVWLAKKYENWDVDCEYNRVMEDQVKFNICQDLIDARDFISNQVASAKKEAAKNPDDYFLQFGEDDFKYVDGEIGAAIDKNGEQRRKITSPDIIVHERRKNKPENNWLVIELKPDWAAKRLILMDLVKLIAFTKTKATEAPTYQFGLLLHVDNEGNVTDTGNTCSWLLGQHNGNDCRLIPFQL